MSEKPTTEYIRKEVRKRGYTLIGEYINAKTKMTLQDKEGYLYNIKWNGFKKCKEPLKFHQSNPYTIKNIKLWMKTNAIGYELISTEYKCSHEKLIFKCPKCKQEFDSSWDDFHSGKRCHYCSIPPRKIELGINTIWDTDRWMCDLGVSEYDAKRCSHSSSEKVTVTCPNCGKQKEIIINNIYKRKSIGCSCGDGFSYNEKFITSLLDQLEIEYTKEYKPEWSNNKRYDFYIKDFNTIIECHGRQHYDNYTFSYCGGKTLQEEQDNDQYKKELALNNNINNYITLDCRNSELEWIKQSIINSELSNLFDLSNINWLKCEEFAISSNKVKEVCDYWYLHNNINNERLTITHLAKIFNLSKSSIVNFLKKGRVLGWCEYITKEEYEERIKQIKNND